MSANSTTVRRNADAGTSRMEFAVCIKIDVYTVYDWPNAFTKIAALNGAAFAEYTDWRLPNVNELQSLVNYGKVHPSVDAAFDTNCAPGCTVTGCSCIQPTYTWTASTFESFPSAAWAVEFSNGFVNAGDKTTRLYARAARGGL